MPGRVVVSKGKTSPVHTAICPHCGKASDLRGYRDMGVLEQDAEIECSHCDRKSVVQGVTDRVIVVWGTSTGVLHQVRCPACRKPEDLTELYTMGTLEEGNTVTCEHCNIHNPIVNVVRQTLVTLAPRR